MKEYIVEIAKAVDLREGSEGVKAFLRLALSEPGLSSKESSRRLRIPIPLVAAMRQEMLKRDLILPGPTIRLSETGEKYCREELGMEKSRSNVCQNCLGLKYPIPTEYKSVLEQLREDFLNRPVVDLTLDQAHGTAETALRRAILALEKGLLFDSHLVFLGDDDYVSRACYLLSREVFGQNKSLYTVLDIDERLVQELKVLNDADDANFNALVYDVRQDLPKNLHGQFDTLFTDPPYTTLGSRTFLRRAGELLRKENGLYLFLSYAHKDYRETYLLERDILDVGFYIEEQIPGFNQYIGASILGNTGQMLILRRYAGEEMESVDEKFYTGDK